MKLALAALLLCACFKSEPREGLLCGRHDECPSGMTCDRFAVQPTCRLDGSDAGARPDPNFGASGAPAMVSLLGGTFSMGCTSNQGGCLDDEAPVRDVSVGAFTITRDEITQGEYAACVDDHGCTAPLSLDRAKAQLPIGAVSWTQARDYCVWAKMRLPTEAEWEYAARGPGGRTYPWGETPAPDCDLANLMGCTSDVVLAPGSKPNGRTPEGVNDLAGNLAEWVNDYYETRYDASETKDPRGPSSGIMRVLRGGSFRSDAVSLRSYRRAKAAPDSNQSANGFRCLR